MNATPFTERITRFEASGHHYTYLVNAGGVMLAVDDEGRFGEQTQADDRVIWERRDDGFRHEASGKVVASATVDHAGVSLDIGSGPCEYRANHGPERMPSDYLRHFQQHGWVCLTSILSPETVIGLQQVACTDRFEGHKYDASMPAISQHPAVAQTVAEPLSLWLIRRYMQTDDIRLGHVPGFAVLNRDDGKRIVQGWHSDYPYHWGVPAQGRVPTATGPTVLGVQRNVCVSDFTGIGGATAFKLGSHIRDQPPPREWGLASDHYQPGYRAEHGLPYSGPDADIVEAPGGSIILYDSRTWHRAGVNRTDRKRAALLQAMIPMYIMPKNDTSVAYKHFLSSDVYTAISDRERDELRRLLVHHFIGPGGQYAIAPDTELTQHIKSSRSEGQAY
jgi:hypothetical protein